MTPLLANGMIMLMVYPLWATTLAVAGLLAVVALGLAFRRKARRFVVFALIASVAPLVVPVLFADPILRYGSGHTEPVILLGLSTVPPLIAGLAVYLSRRPGSGEGR